jgi:hypothetical protein
MKARKFAGMVLIVLLASFTLRHAASGSIKGSVTPATGATTAWAESMTDTLKSTVTDGSFEITDAKPGTYKVIIEAKPPFKMAVKDNVPVKDGQATDLGQIILEK